MRRRREWSLIVLGAVFLIVAGGYAAATLALLGILALLILRRRPEIRRVERWAPVAFWALACVLSLRSATPHTAIGPQLAGLAAFAALWLGVLPPALFRPSRDADSPLADAAAETTIAVPAGESAGAAGSAAHEERAAPSGDAAHEERAAPSGDASRQEPAAPSGDASYEEPAEATGGV